MGSEKKGLTYKERLRKEFTGSGLKEMFFSALIMFVFIYGINTYRDGYIGLKLTLLMVGMFVVVWPVMSVFWVTLGYLVDKIRAGNEEIAETQEKDTQEVTLKASADSIPVEGESKDLVREDEMKDKGADRL